MNELLVISQQELLQFGCPHCGCSQGGAFLSIGTCSLWCCEICAQESAIVEVSIAEILQMRVRNTDIKDLIGHHPYRTNICDDCMITVKKFSLPPELPSSLLDFLN